MAKKSRRMFTGNLERAATANRLRSDNEKRRGTEVYSAGCGQNQIRGKVNEPLALTLSPLWRGEGIKTLGGSRPLPELFATAGCRFEFSAKTIQPLMKLLRDELAKLD